MKQKIFNALRFLYVLFDKTLGTILGMRLRKHVMQFAYRLKVRFFPEYGSYIPEYTAAGALASNVSLLTPVIPEWALKEMHDLALAVDPALAPTPNFIASCQYYTFPVIDAPGRFYKELIQKCNSQHYTHCFTIPWLKTGGADLVTLNHIYFLAKQKNTRVLVLMTERGESPWLYRVPSNVDVLNTSIMTGNITHDHLILVIAKILTQLRIDVLHVINSHHAWGTIIKHGNAIKQRTRIFVSIFCDDYDTKGYPVGFARQYLPKCYKHIDRVFSDNENFPQQLCSIYGYDPHLFKVIRSPLDKLISFKDREPAGRRILWAGRLDRQKRPDILFLIAQAMPDVEFNIYGSQVLGHKDKIIKKLSKLDNVNMRGAFNGAEELPFDAHAAFLYTSQWDGMPTIILAAANAGIPIVASCVGGIGELISKESGYPVFAIDCINDYVQSIKEILACPKQAKERAKVAHGRLTQQYSQENFESTIFNIDGYFSNADNGNSVCAV